MFRATLISPAENDTTGSILLHNIKAADISQNVNLFICVSQAWMFHNKQYNYQVYEKFLRDNGMKSYLLAKKVELNEGQKLVNLFSAFNESDPIECKYQCFFLCESKETCTKTIEEEWLSYDVNFEMLKEVGFAVDSSYDPSTFDVKSIKYFQEEEMNVMGEEIFSNKKKIELRPLHAEEIIFETRKNLIDQELRKKTQTVSSNDTKSNETTSTETTSSEPTSTETTSSETTSTETTSTEINAPVTVPDLKSILVGVTKDNQFIYGFTFNGVDLASDVLYAVRMLNVKDLKKDDVEASQKEENTNN
jgi:hypothetical protein